MSTDAMVDYFDHFTAADGNVTVHEHARRAANMLGLRQTSTGSCPRRLARLPHLEWECWCASRLNDHGRRYRDNETNEPVVMWEPYPFSGADLAPVLAAAAADGLRVTVAPASPWYPGRTIALLFRMERTAT